MVSSSAPSLTEVEASVCVDVFRWLVIGISGGLAATSIQAAFLYAFLVIIQDRRPLRRRATYRNSISSRPQGATVDQMS